MMEKDYTFYPTRTESPEFLSEEQIEHFNHHGFISPLPGFTADEISKHREYFDHLLQQIEPRSRVSSRIPPQWFNPSGFREWPLMSGNC